MGEKTPEKEAEKALQSLHRRQRALKFTGPAVMICGGVYLGTVFFAGLSDAILYLLVALVVLDCVLVHMVNKARNSLPPKQRRVLLEKPQKDSGE